MGQPMSTTPQKSPAAKSKTSDAEKTPFLHYVGMAMIACALLYGVWKFFFGGGPRMAPVSGQVTFQKKPPPRGAMILFSDEPRGNFMTAKFDEEGNYRVEMAEGWGLPLGDYKVAILPPPYKLTQDFINKHKGQDPHLAMFPSIPLRYRDPDKSGLVLKLTSSGSKFDVNMVP
jgi:hypothetical protein